MEPNRAGQGRLIAGGTAGVVVLVVAVVIAKLIGGGPTTLKWTPQILGDLKQLNRERTAATEEIRFLKADCANAALNQADCAGAENYYATEVENDANAWSTAVREGLDSTRSLSGLASENEDLTVTLAHSRSFVELAAYLHRNHGFPPGVLPLDPDPESAPWWNSPQQVVLIVSKVFDLARAGEDAAIAQIDDYLDKARFPSWEAA